MSAQVSELKSEIAATASTSTPTVVINVIENEVFALSLPRTHHSGGLTTGAQIGIGVGAGVAGLSLLLLLLSLLLRRRRLFKRQENLPANTGSIQSSGGMVSSSQPTTGHVSPLQVPTPGPGSGPGSGDPRMFPIPWPYQPGSNYSATYPLRTTQDMVQPSTSMPYGTVPAEFVQQQQQQPSTSMPYGTIPAEFVQQQSMGPYQQDPTVNYYGPQRAEELEGQQTVLYEADVSHLRPGGFSVLPGGRIYPHPQEMGRNTPTV